MGRHRGNKRMHTTVCEVCGAGIAPTVTMCGNCRDKSKPIKKLQQMIHDTVERTRNVRERLNAPKNFTHKTRKQIVNIPLDEFEYLRGKYNAKHKTLYSYGQLVSMLHSGKIKIEELRGAANAAKLRF